MYFSFYWKHFCWYIVFVFTHVCKSYLSENLDIVTKRDISLLSNIFLLGAHFFIFSIFQTKIGDIIVRIEPKIKSIFYIIDSYSKCKSIASSVEIASTINNNFLFKFFIALCSNQLNKYIYERFLIDSKKVNSLYKNLAIILCIIIFSSDFIDKDIIFDKKIIIAFSCIVLLGQQFDKIQPLTPGQSKLKLKSNAKTRSILSKTTAN